MVGSHCSQLTAASLKESAAGAGRKHRMPQPGETQRIRLLCLLLQHRVPACTCHHSHGWETDAGSAMQEVERPQCQ